MRLLLWAACLAAAAAIPARRTRPDDPKPQPYHAWVPAHHSLLQPEPAAAREPVITHTKPVTKLSPAAEGDEGEAAAAPADDAQQQTATASNSGSSGSSSSTSGSTTATTVSSIKAAASTAGSSSSTTSTSSAAAAATEQEEDEEGEEEATQEQEQEDEGAQQQGQQVQQQGAAAAQSQQRVQSQQTAAAANATALPSVTPASTASYNQEKCDLCKDHRWLFIIATGRSGSTTILEAVNSLPGVRLTGENLGSLAAASAMVPDRESFYTEVGGNREHGATRKHSMLCVLQDYFATIRPHAPAVPKDSIRGFKELVVPFADPDHLPLDSITRWGGFLEELFPCARIIFSMRRDTKAQSESVGKFADWKAADTTDALDRTNQALQQWHEQRKDRTFLMWLEDFSEDKFTELAQWLGFNCKFAHLPHANDEAGAGRYAGDYENSQVECDAPVMSGTEW